MQIVNEGLKAGDLDGVVSKRFSVDQFKSKMGEDRNIMVLAFTVDGMAPAKDLEKFAETGYKAVLDADATPGTLEASIPTTPEAYEMRVNEMRVSEARHFFDKYDMMECKISENTMSMKKTGAGHELKFELHKFGPTDDIMKETKAFKIDMESIAECTHLTKYFCTYDITKTNENKFIFTKGDQSALVSKTGW